MVAFSIIDELQKNHYDSISDKYAEHYGDSWSQKYRDYFINESLVKNIILNNSNVIDAMCGSGETTLFLLNKGANVTGIDISYEEIKRFKHSYPSCQVICKSIFDTGLMKENYDCIIVVGGLHHLQPMIDDAINEIHRLLKRGGFFVLWNHMLALYRIFLEKSGIGLIVFLL